MAFTTDEETKLKAIINAYDNAKRICDLPDGGLSTAGKLIEVYDQAKGIPQKMSLPGAVGNAGATWCGCRWRKGNASPEGEPIGNISMLANLKSILGLGGYLVQNDHSRKKLSSQTHYRLETGEEAKLDGSMGHYNWGTGVTMYYAPWDDYEYDYEAVSPTPVPGHWNYKIPIFSVPCSGASAIDRTNLKLVNYCNRSAQYRGGTNDASLDGKWNTMCGKPVVNIAENTLQRYAEKNGDRWGATMDPAIFMIGVLTRIVFHNRNIGAARNTAMTADGLYQGGLGMGVDNVNSYFGNQYATVDMDALADKGDAMGVFSVDCMDGDEKKLTINNIPCFFGLKNFYHYLWCMRHLSILSYNADKTIDVYQKQIWDSTAIPTDNTTGMRKIGTIPLTTEGWIKRMNLQHMCYYPLEVGGSESTNYGDYFWRPDISSGLRGLFALGDAGNGGDAGVSCFNGGDGPSYAWVNYGAALCEAAEDWDTEPFYVSA